ncbi:cytidylyltransferase domain-containing protein [Brachyspira hyodysenteriae]|uniref:cytidylyltransferase domain-containing protein n=1 Tax=Brachyspira hyodysenteriae TaxID=159 RepID=UPI00063DD022|nr:spore coat protein [Brachyspira hyodysenteriae]KLI40898.1 spore coat protein [Brachyspira hyodysenteriae]MCZ9887715.1 spore coat protein [Brachyspira hyodysenteriae]MCZ9982435.1 spore coat protein [Brachyspira hyodysenteriae]
MKKIVIVLASRLGSTRLPQKALKPMANCNSMLELIIKRLRSSKRANDVIVATEEKSYEAFKNIFDKLKCNYFVGSEEDVLNRYRKAAEEFNADIVVRATGDNPLVSVKALDMIIDYHIEKNADLSHYDLLPYGSGVEVINYEALKIADDNSKDSFEHEHITQYHYRNPDKFKIENPKVNEEFAMPELRTTVDTIEDYNNVCKIFEKYNNDIYVDVDTIISDIRNGR